MKHRLDRTISDLEQMKSFVEDLREQFPDGGAFALSGELGAGKTTLVRLFVGSWFHATNQTAPRIISPTFVIHQHYDLDTSSGRGVDHFDLYRLDRVTEEAAIEIGLLDAFEKCQLLKGYLFVEWAERLAPGLVSFTGTIQISLDAHGYRSIRVS